MVVTREPTTPKVSVLLPTFNSASFLDEAIRSVLNQTYVDFELIIVDNNSTDNTQALVEPYLSDARVRYYRNATNIGLGNNWNLALTYAKGEYIKFLCSDDKFHFRLLEKFVPILDVYPQVSLVTSGREVFGAKSYTWEIPYHALQNGYKMIAESLRLHNFLGEPTSVMFRKKDLRGGVFNTNYKYLIDWDMWLRLLRVGDCYIVPETLSYFRIHEGQATAQALSSLNNYFEEYHFYKSIKPDKGLLEFLSEGDLNVMVKKRALYCVKALIKIGINGGIRKNWLLINKVLKIQKAEKVPIHYYLNLFSKKPF
jgi:glycosyltransferase involved in cell wall biosynthesis